MKNYYKILQVDKDASPEIIKVAYKLLVKKNHPDLKEGEEKKIAEEKIKQINEAYEVLSEPSKKSTYDSTLINETISQEQYQLILNENQNLKKELNYLKNNYAKTQYANSNTNNYNQTQYTNMYDNYDNNNIKNNNYSNSNNFNNYKNIFNIDYIKKVLNEKIKSLIALAITLLIIFVFLKLPFIKNLLPESFNSNYLGIFIFIIICYIYFFRNKQ